jgi:hypothetical protein
MYHQIRQTLLCNPTNAAAWLQMSTLVDDPQQQRECLERVLALDPHNASAREGLECLRLKALLATLATCEEQQPIPVPKKLGEYLVTNGLISEFQLERALSEQRRRKTQGLHTPLGEVLLNEGWLTPQALAYALVSQLPQQRGIYLLLGEYLVAEGIISCRHLEAALADQLALKQRGEHVQLGELLVRRNALTRAELERLLDQQRREFYSCFGD